MLGTGALVGNSTKPVSTPLSVTSTGPLSTPTNPSTPLPSPTGTGVTIYTTSGGTSGLRTLSATPALTASATATANVDSSSGTSGAGRGVQVGMGGIMFALSLGLLLL